MRVENLAGEYIRLGGSVVQSVWREMTSNCKNMAQTRQSDFSIEHILTKAGEKYEKRRRLDTFSCLSNTSSHSHSDSDEPLGSEEDEEIVVDNVQKSGCNHTTGYLQNCVPSFDWLYYTRYRPPKLPRELFFYFTVYKYKA